MKFVVVILFTIVGTTAFSQSKEDVALNNQAVALMEEGKYKEALPVLNRLAEKDTANYIFRYNRAVTFFNLKQYQNAIAEYKYLNRLIPEQTEYIFQIGNAYEHLDSSNLAISYYNEAIAVDSDHFIYFFKRGTQFLKQEKFKEAIDDFGAALELNPKHRNSYHNRGIARYKLGNYKEACDDWCTADQMGNPHSKTHLTQFCNKYQPCRTDK